MRITAVDGGAPAAKAAKPAAKVSTDKNGE